MPRQKDLTNRQFGKLVVAERAPNTRTTGGYSIARWWCRCECGARKIMRSAALLSGKRKSCGGCRFKNHIGLRYGHTIVVRRTGRKRGEEAIYECRCDCGRTHYSTICSMRQGSSCGCYRRRAAAERNKKRLSRYVGRDLGGGNILRLTDEFQGRKRMVEVQCPFCPNTYRTTPSAMGSGNTKSCGCHKRRVAVERFQKWTEQFVGRDLGGGKVLRVVDERLRGYRMVEVQCPFCPNTYRARPAVVASGNTKSCGCIKKSSGEAVIERWLKSQGYRQTSGSPTPRTYDREARFDDCRDKKPLPFDFAVNVRGRMRLVEFQGPHHYEAVTFGGSGDGAARLVATKRRDRIKARWAARRGYPLLRIHYRRKDEIPALLADFLEGGRASAPSAASRLKGVRQPREHSAAAGVSGAKKKKGPGNLPGPPRLRTPRSRPRRPPRCPRGRRSRRA